MLPLSQIQSALWQALTAALTPVKVLDGAGPDELFPYCTIGELQALPDDTLADTGTTVTWSVHFWSRQPGMQEIETLMDKAKTALHYQQLPVTGFQWVQTVWEWAQTLRDIDGVTRHGVMRFRVMTFHN